MESIVLGGLDVISLWGDTPMQGVPEFSTEYNNYTFLFSSSDNVKLFQENDKYIPQAGGYCAWAMSGWDAAVCPMTSSSCSNCQTETCVNNKCHNCTGCPQGGTEPPSFDIDDDCWGEGGIDQTIYGVFPDLYGDEHMFLFLGEGARELFAGEHINETLLPKTYTNSDSSFNLDDYSSSEYFATMAIDIWSEYSGEFNTETK